MERTADAIGEDIAAREQQQIQRALQLDLPIIPGEPVSILYIEMDGTGGAGCQRERRVHLPRSTGRLTQPAKIAAEQKFVQFRSATLNRWINCFKYEISP